MGLVCCGLPGLQAQGPQKPKVVCQDKNENCEGWSNASECARNPEYMKEQCPLSCGQCCPEADVLCERRRKRILSLMHQNA